MSKVPKQSLVNLVTPFLEQHDKVYVAIGCGRVYVAPVPSEGCSICGNQHENTGVTSLADLDQVQA